MTPGHRRILKAGLTGGIASGKSTVAGFFRELGAHVIDADRVVHEILAPGGSAVEAVVARFGGAIRSLSGGIDRAALGKVVFSDVVARRDLEAIVHPAVRAAIAAALDAFAAAPGGPVAIVDAALLVETGIHRDLDRLIVLRCSEETQIARLRERNGLDRSEALSRIAAQAPLATKLRFADYVIDTEGPLEATRARVAEVHRALVGESS